MKSRLGLLCAVAVMFLSAARAQAAQIAAEYFDYGPTAQNWLGGLGDASGGWAGPWDKPNDVTRPDYSPSTNLDLDAKYPASQYNNSANVGGMAGTFQQVSTNYPTYRDFATPQTGTIWVSAIVRYVDITTSTSDHVQLWLKQGDGGGTAGVGIRDGKAKLTNGSGGSNDDGTGTQTIGSGVYLLLAKVDMNYSGTLDRIAMWIDPDLSGGEAGLGSPTLMKENKNSVGASLVGIGVGTSDQAGQGIDAIRVGTTLADVTSGPEPAPALQLAPEMLSFTGHVSDPAPAAQSVLVQNTGVGTLAWTAAVRAPAPAWLTLTNASGTDDDSFEASVNWQGMAPGTYTAYVDVTDPGASNSPQTVPVTMVVQPDPTPLLQLWPGTLNFTGYVSDAAPAARNVTVENTGIGSLAWTAVLRAPAQAWIALTNASGTDNDAFGVSVNWAGMSAGTYTAYVDVTDPQAYNSPQTLTVTIEVQPDPTPLLQLSAASLAFTGKASAPVPAPQSVTVQNIGVGSLNWTAAVRAPAPAWISLTTASGSDGDSFTVGVDWQGMTPGSYTAYVDVADLNAGNSPQTVTVTMQVRSEADTSTHSFSNKARGSHPGTVTFAGGQVTVDMSALPAGTQVYRAMFVPHRIGCSGASAAEGYSYQPLQVEAADAPGVWLQTVGPQHLNLDCTAAVQRAMLTPDRRLVLNAVSFAGLGASNAELRLDVWCDQPAVHAIQQVTNTQAVCRNGDTMITFSEVNTPITNPNPTGQEYLSAVAAMDAVDEVRYRVYRSSQPIDAITIRTAELVNEVKPLSGWNDEYYGLERNGEWSNSIVPRHPVADMTLADVGTGIYVRRATAEESAYYAVSRVVNGEEDLSIWSAGGNQTAAPVAETVGTGMVLQWKTAVQTMFWQANATGHWFVRWECPPTSNMPGIPHNYLVTVPTVTADPRPVCVSLHQWGGWLESSSAGWYEADKGSLMVTTNQNPWDWWDAYHENLGTIRPFPVVEGNAGGVVQPYSQRRIWSFLQDYVATRWNVDWNNILVSGQSMGGSGADAWGIRAADKFAYIVSWVGVHIPAMSPSFTSSYTGPFGEISWNCPYLDTGLSAFEYWNNARWVRDNVSTDTPYLVFANGKNDASIGWPQAREYVQALIETRRPFIFRWGQNGHDQRSAWPGLSTTCPIDFEKDKTLPAFTYCSLDNNMGNGSPTDGDPAGYINAYTLWQPQDSVDTTGRWEMTCYLYNTAPQPTCTVDITPRRTQAFDPRPGMYCRWTNSDIATGTVIESGTVQVDAYGLVTVPQATVGKTKNRIAITISGDADEDGQVNVFDVFVIAESWNSQVGDSTYNPAADLDGDGFVNVFDIFVLAENWNR